MNGIVRRMEEAVQSAEICLYEETDLAEERIRRNSCAAEKEQLAAEGKKMEYALTRLHASSPSPAVSSENRMRGLNNAGFGKRW